MDNARTLNRNLETMAWAALFIWWGVVDKDIGLFRSLPSGTEALGLGLILLGLNAARALNGIPTSGFTITLGTLALVLGALLLAGSLLSLPFQLPVLAIMMIALGVILLARMTVRTRTA
jgi:hypothetical protein